VLDQAFTFSTLGSGNSDVMVKNLLGAASLFFTSPQPCSP
jgi:hypothetical protein